MTLNRRNLLTSLAALPIAGGATTMATAASNATSGDYWCVTCIDNGHAILQVTDEEDFEKNKHYIDNNECGICGSQFFKSDLTHFRTGMRYAPIEIPSSDRKMLLDARDILIPGLHQFRTTDIDLDVAVDFKAVGLIVKGYSFSQKRSLGFAFTKKTIADGTYKAHFAPNLTALLESFDRSTIGETL